MYQQRPTGVTVISVLFFIAGIPGILGGLLILLMPIVTVGEPLLDLLASFQILVALAAITIAAFDIAVGWGLWTLQNWARITAVIILALETIASLVGGIYMLFGIDIAGVPVRYPGGGIASLLLAILPAWMIWYLLSSDITMLFAGQGIPGPNGGTVPMPPPPVPTPTSSPPARLQQAAPPPARERTVPLGVPPQAAGWLVSRSGARSGQSFALKQGNNTVGRDSRRADIVLDDPTISGEHARIRYEGGQFFAYDLASTNGTFINNRKIQRQMLMDGDVIRFGSAEAVFKKV